MSTDDAEHYTAPHPAPDGEDGGWPDQPRLTDPERVLWVEGYGFDSEVFAEVVAEINEMFQDRRSWVVADEPENSTPKEAFDEAVRLREGRRDTAQ